MRHLDVVDRVLLRLRSCEIDIEDQLRVALAHEKEIADRVAAYLLETARKAHLWYHKAHVLLEGDDPDTIALRDARLVLARASRIVFRNGLALLGLTAPERM